MEFYNREKEIKDLLNIVRQEPNFITFIYGPINSGKTILMLEMINRLPKDYVAFYIDLRRRYIIDDKSFVRVLFRIRHEKNLRDILEEIIATSDKVLRFFNIPIPANILKEFLKEKPIDDVFEFLEDFFLKISEMKKIILILDELQVIKDIKINEFLIYKLFNFLLSLTKVLHICHVFAITSDSTFIEKIYNEAMLQGRCEYYLVDDFDKETVEKILCNKGFSDEEINIVWHYFGGKPIYISRVIEEKRVGGDIKKLCKKFQMIRNRQMRDLLYSLRREDKRKYENVMEILRKFLYQDSFEYEELTNEILWLIDKNILFLDPISGKIKPQSHVELNAIRNFLSKKKT